MKTEIDEFKEKIADLTIEIERIKKTSKQRFEKNKKLSERFSYYENMDSRASQVVEFLKRNGFTIKYHQGLVRFDHSVFSAINGLIDKRNKIHKPRVDGVYAVIHDGERKIVTIRNSLCWQVFDDSIGDYNGLHFYNMTDFVLLEAI